MRRKHLLTPKMLGVGTPNSTFSNPSARLGSQKHLGPRGAGVMSKPDQTSPDRAGGVGFEIFSRPERVS